MRLFLQNLIVMSVCALMTPAMAAPLGVVNEPPKPVLVLREGLDGPINEWSGPAKFVLYDNGTVFTDASDETSPRGETPRYYETRLTTAQAARLLKSLGVRRIVGSSQRQYGEGEGVTWQVLYWGSPEPGRVTVIDDLGQSPARVAALIRRLERFPNAGKPFLGFDYLINFSNASERMVTVQWPQEWRKPKLPPAMLAGVRAPDMTYETWLDAPRAQRLEARLTKARTHCVSVNGHTWMVTLGPAPRLPSDALWVESPVAPTR